MRTSRQSPFAQRIEQQQKRLNLPDLPTTTIGSFRKAEKFENTVQLEEQTHYRQKHMKHS
ncbi:hypothetical protein ACVNPZ_01025 [Staphylococcus aureus]